MRQSTKDEGTKIAAASKELNVTSVTIRRYISEFDIETTSDDNGIKVLPPNAMKELHEIRRMKEEGMPNTEIMDALTGMRPKSSKPKSKEKPETNKRASKSNQEEENNDAEDNVELEASEDNDEDSKPQAKKERYKDNRKPAYRKKVKASEEAEETAEEESSSEPSETQTEKEEEDTPLEIGQVDKSKHSLTCQTCGKTFEHLNPRLRDCLDCYRAKRKERRRGGADRHKNVIQHPLAQQVLSKSQQNNNQNAPATVAPIVVMPTSNNQLVKQTNGVRSYRKAIEETRQITSNLKRRLERPDLPESERRWLEQIYAYELILHQGWRHLAEYKASTQAQKLD
jgi:DNA-binding transcriptional MerR regulator